MDKPHIYNEPQPKYPKETNALEKWCATLCSCLRCEYTWAAVYPVSVAFLECPNCGYFNDESLMG